MAVQAHYHSSNTFSSVAGIGKRSDNNLQDDFQPLQHNQITSNLLGHRNFAAQMMNVAGFSEPESETTCIASGGRKRAREDQMVAGEKTRQLYQHYQHLRQPEQPRFHVVADNLNFYEPGKDSGPASTSGSKEQLGSYLCNNRDIELETLIRLQNQKLRSMVEETRRKQSRSLLSMIEQQTLRRLVEKETELEKANRANMELEEKVKQISAENQMWFNVAKNSEATIASLRLTLEQILLQSAGNLVAAEGFGETDGGAGDEARSCSEAEVKKGKSCKGCGGYDASFLVLPCRHLCLCRYCELGVRCCPVCNTVKNSTLQVFMS